MHFSLPYSINNGVIFHEVIQNPSVPPFLRGDQVWRKGSQCTVIKVDMEGVPPSCIVKVNSTGAYADTELALLHPCKFEIFDYILRTMCPACEKIGIVRNINESKQTVDYTICNTDEMITNVPFHKIQKAIIPVMPSLSQCHQIILLTKLTSAPSTGLRQGRPQKRYI